MEDLSAIFSPNNMVVASNMQQTIQQEPPKTEPVVQQNQPVVQNEPIVEPIKPVEIAEPIKAWVNTTFGTENVEEVVNGYKSLAQLREEKATWEATKTELETQNKQLKEQPPVSPYKSKFAERADEIYEATKGQVSAETIARFYALDPAKLTDDQKLDLLEQIENPQSSAEDRALVRNEKYDTTDDTLTEGQKAVRRMQLSKDVATASERLGKLASEAFKPLQTSNQQDSPENIQAEANRIDFWKNNTNQIDTTVFKEEMPFKLKLPNGKGGVDEVDDNFSFTLAPEIQKQVLDVVSKELTSPANAKIFTPDKDGIARANAYVTSTVRNVAYKVALMAQQKHFEASVGKIHETYAKLLNNTDFLTGKVVSIGGQAGVVDYNKSAEAYLAKNR